jgi:hypothetical protein
VLVVPAVALAALSGAALVGGSQGDDDRAPDRARAPAVPAASTSAGEARSASAAAPDPAKLRAQRNALGRQGRLTAHLLRPALLRDAPAGARVARVGRRTGYGAPRIYAAVAFRPGWVGVRALQRPNGSLGWLPEAALRVQRSAPCWWPTSPTAS